MKSSDFIQLRSLLGTYVTATFYFIDCVNLSLVLGVVLMEHWICQRGNNNSHETNYCNEITQS